jgi:hypothetical protein
MLWNALLWTTFLWSFRHVVLIVLIKRRAAQILETESFIPEFVVLTRTVQGSCPSVRPSVYLKIYVSFHRDEYSGPKQPLCHCRENYTEWMTWLLYNSHSTNLNRLPWWLLVPPHSQIGNSKLAEDTHCSSSFCVFPHVVSIFQTP